MTSTSEQATWRVNERTQDPPTRRAGWSHDWQPRWSHEAGRKPVRPVPCSWQATASDGSRESSIGSVTNRPFTDWVAKNISGWQLHEHVANPHAWDGDVSRTTLSDFFLYKRTAATSA